MIAEQRLIRELSFVKQITDLHTSTIIQSLTEGWLATTNLTDYLTRCRDLYKSRMDNAIRVLDSTVLDPFIKPSSGFYIFARLPSGLNAMKVRVLSGERGVIFAPGSSFCPSPQHSFGDSIRICVSSSPEPHLRVGLDRLNKLLLELV